MKFTPTIILTALTILSASVTALPPAPEALVERDSLEKRVTHQGLAFLTDLRSEITCGGHPTSDDHVVLLPKFLYNGGKVCDRWVHLTQRDTGKSSYGKVRGYCNSCSASNEYNLGPYHIIYGVDWNFKEEGWSP
ncbi:hypothetical protein FOMPIDRAFT_1019425 [Fomitopsis schrenkii]|uniref:Killer toxin Kp4 domain-containing protein n=1 Tax=Fomitopsis schrenkii TaxID=2126942 RepID=S8FA56_FOMSC|nr:hypothetical protein FOMPIDRAFT_1019425 [Fomitopsis schrenkii]